MRKKRFEKEKEKQICFCTSKFYSYLKLILIIIVIVSLLLFALNQFFSWYYKAELLTGPCNLCLDLNPDLRFYSRSLVIKSLEEDGIKIKNIIIKSP